MAWQTVELIICQESLIENRQKKLLSANNLGAMHRSSSIHSFNQQPVILEMLGLTVLFIEDAEEW